MTRALALLVAVIAAGAVVVEVARYDAARTAWALERDRMGSEAYDAARSDAAYIEVEARRAGARVAGWALAGALVALGALAGGRAPIGAGEPERAPAGRLLAASVLDAAALGGSVALAAWLASLPTSLALSDALARALPALAIAVPLAMLARGATLGMLAVGMRVGTPPPWRAALAIALLPLTAAWLALALVPLAALVALRRAPRAAWLAPHLAMTGLRAR